MFDIPELCETEPFTCEEENAIAELKQLCKAYPSIRFQTENYFLTKYLRYADWNPRKAFEAIRRHYELKVSFIFHILLLVTSYIVFFSFRLKA